MTDFTPYHEDQELDNNTSENIHFRDILEQAITRRSLISKTASGAVALTLASTLTACGSDSDSSSTPVTTTPPVDPTKLPQKLSFTPVAKNLNDIVTVPEGYEAKVLYAMGDSINQSYAAWDDSQVPSGPSFQFRSGDCHDGMSYFGLNTTTGRYDDTKSDHGLLVLNHEYINQTFLHPTGPTNKGTGPRPEDEVIREVNAHGVSIIHLKKDSKTQAVEILKNSIFNRRITASTPMTFTGVAAGSTLLSTRFSPSGLKTRGTQNNCGNGYTPWGTYLTAEENFIGYFVRNATDDTLRSTNEVVALNRYGLKQGAKSRYQWETALAGVENQDMYDRWNASVVGASASLDYRNIPNTFGWIVEIDPFDSRQDPVKRTSLGRFAHEDCRTSRAIEGQNLAFYMGDDSRGEYIYKFVSDAKWDAKDVNGGYAAGDKYMNSGKLYVAKFNSDGTGQWIELSMSNPAISAYTTYKFADQADVVTHARIAADAVGATKMDRPEWVAVNPNNGEVYVTLTNNSNRGTNYVTDAANPRNYTDPEGGKGNVNGHIIRFREDADNTTATTFKWDIYLFGAEAKMLENVNLSGLTDNNDFSSPDGMWFDPRGVLWIQTDDGAYTDVTNCMMLAALPGTMGDGGKATALSGAGTQDTFMGAKVTDENLRRFLTGPKECEITGVTMTPDYKAIFINVQHPGEDSTAYNNATSHWPATQTDPSNTTARPRSATVVITRKNGGVIAG
ncbi:PhoX family phosphatase [Acinetobacter sp. C_4_1]|uniref:PhoX family protein n=1 Tax=unclassified Acinetobacter TaxID=196816 RepID=UPI0021B825D1|nr:MULTISPECIES: PhoX family phosphatase [unclassified Acinetobacter]MCT8090661.1 PhoX family phosphatase [Acinetobacter sp. F_3_1]MCT8099139.1 PhoX family phosphatase [Acinetobacter sp. C_3_1]MCT8102212.1 PhoX family phosphatase [Acinetobacter sp. C_4_1]MCT8135959.1 PhoX family phosphatase [Acinetobacter sp. T_3_1]